jgi:hypothetical protein
MRLARRFQRDERFVHLLRDIIAKGAWKATEPALAIV